MSEGNTILTDLLYNYVVAQRSDAKDPVLAALQTETYEMGTDAVRLSITPEQSSLISLLVGLIGTNSTPLRCRFAVAAGVSNNPTPAATSASIVEVCIAYCAIAG